MKNLLTSLLTCLKNEILADRFTPSYGVLLHCWPAGAMEAAPAVLLAARRQLSFKEFWGVQFEKGCLSFSTTKSFWPMEEQLGGFSASNLYPPSSL